MKSITILYEDNLTFDEALTTIHEAWNRGIEENETMQFANGFKVTRKYIGGHSSYRVVKINKQQ